MIESVIIVGGGLSSTAAALELSEKGFVPLILDVGYTPEKKFHTYMNLYDYRQDNDIFELLIGSDFSGIKSIINNKQLSPKLTMPLMNYVLKNSEILSPIKTENFTAIQSFSMGGLANAWGAGVYRFNDADLEKFPVSEKELTKYYKKLSKEIGISGANDDLIKYFGYDEDLLPPLELSKKAKMILKKYIKKKEKLNRKGVFLGRPRLAVLSKSYNGRKACNYSNFELWLPELEYIYTPKFTLKRLIKENKIKYINNVLVKSWKEEENGVKINAIELKTGNNLTFFAKKLLIGAGTINTTKIVLQTHNDTKTKLNLLDNPLIQIPFLFPSLIGTAIEKKCFGMTQLNIILDFKEQGILQGSFIELSSVPRAMLNNFFPLPVKSNITLIKEMSQAVIVLYLFLPSSYLKETYIKLNSNNAIHISSKGYNITKEMIKTIEKSLKPLGGITSRFLFKFPEPGNGIHYAGTLPMKSNPKNKYQTTKYGKLYREKNVYIIDGSLFSCLPAKNLSFTMMANAMRITEYVAWKLKNEKQ